MPNSPALSAAARGRRLYSPRGRVVVLAAVTQPRLLSSYRAPLSYPYSNKFRSQPYSYPKLLRNQSTSTSTPTSPAHAPTTAVEDPSKTSSSPPPTPPTTPKEDPKPPVQVKDSNEPKQPLRTRVWQKVKHEAQHYWAGSKLLAKEVRISARLQWKILHGESLTRRERRQVRKFSPCSFATQPYRTCISFFFSAFHFRFL